MARRRSEQPGLPEADRQDLPSAVRAPAEVDDCINRAMQLVNDGRHWPSGCSTQDELGESVDGIGRSIGMAGRHRPVMTGIHRLHERDDLVTSDFADHQSVGPQTQCGDEQLVE